MSYMTNSQQQAVEYGRRTSASATTMHGYTRSSVPRSQGNSREASPSRTLGINGLISLAKCVLDHGLELDK